MPQPTDRQSLNKTIEGRYATQRAGGAYNVKEVLGEPGKVPQPFTTIDATSANGQKFQYRNGFMVKQSQVGVSQMKDVRNQNSTLSTYIKGFSNQKYKP
jgi:hypothetical protein